MLNKLTIKYYLAIQKKKNVRTRARGINFRLCIIFYYVFAL